MNIPESETREPTQFDACEPEEQDELPRLCPECDSPLVSDEEHGEILCTECGLVVEEEHIDRGPEWRTFYSEDKRERGRVGAPSTNLMHDSGLSTNIGWRDEDANGRLLPPRKRERMKRLRTWDERFRTKDSKERNLKQALGEIDRMASALGMPKNVRETASVIYRRALTEDLLRGRSIEDVSTAALYAAARRMNTPRSLDEMTRVSRTDKMELARTYRYLARELELEIEPADPVDYLPRFASDIGLSEEVERRARELLEVAMSEGVHSGKSPVGLAAAALYAASILTNQKVTQHEISAVTGVSKVTIRSRYQELLEIQGP